MGKHFDEVERAALQQLSAEWFPYFNEHPMIRNLSDYRQFIHDSFQPGRRSDGKPAKAYNPTGKPMRQNPKPRGVELESD